MGSSALRLLFLVALLTLSTVPHARAGGKMVRICDFGSGSTRQNPFQRSSLNVEAAGGETASLAAQNRASQRGTLADCRETGRRRQQKESRHAGFNIPVDIAASECECLAIAAPSSIATTLSLFSTVTTPAPSTVITSGTSVHTDTCSGLLPTIPRPQRHWVFPQCRQGRTWV